MLYITNTLKLKLKKFFIFNTGKIPLYCNTILNCTTSTCIGISDLFTKGNHQNWQLGFPEPVTEIEYTESKAVMVCEAL